MIEKQYENIKFRLYNSVAEFEEIEKAKFEFTDIEGNIIDIDTSEIDFSMAESRGHFDENYRPNGFDWMVVPEDLTIQCIVLNNNSSITEEEIFSSIGHEYGHLQNVEDYKNGIDEYDTYNGYIAEEQKALMFENFSKYVYNLSIQAEEAFRTANIEIVNKYKNQCNVE